MTREWQSHSGAVNISTTPSVQYSWNEMAGGVNNSRLLSMTYPNGRVLSYNYNGTLNDRISRGTLERYKYLGLATVVQRDHP
jgi:hypothetical protein